VFRSTIRSRQTIRTYHQTHPACLRLGGARV